MFFGDSVFRYPTGRLHDLARTWSQRRSWGSCPSQCCSYPRISGRFRPSRPPAVFRIAHPDNLVGGPAARIPRTHLQTATGRGRFAAAPGFFLRGQSVPGVLFAPRGPMLPWALASLRSSDTGLVRRARAVARKLRPIRQPWGPLPVPGRSWSSRRCRIRVRRPQCRPPSGMRGRVTRPPPVLQRSWLAPSRSRLSRSSTGPAPCLRFCTV